MAEYLGMMTTAKLDLSRAQPTSTGSTVSATSLISGTIVHVAGSGLKLTAPPVSTVRILVMPARARYQEAGGGINPTVKRAAKRSRRRKQVRSRHQMGDFIEEFFGSRAVDLPEIIVKGRVRHLRSREADAGIKLVGRKGTTLGPSRKYYDVDLDAYQLD